MTKTLRHLDWDDLRVFLEAARSQSVSRAARALKLDHSTVSRRLARLEFCVGGALFERNRSGIQLTERGVAVLSRTEGLAASIASLSDDLSETGGRVRLATMEGIASLYLAPKLVSLRESDPGLHVELVTSSKLIRVSRREADLFLSFFPPPDRKLVCEQVGAFATGLYASKSYFERRGKPKSTAELGAHEFVGYIEELVALDTVRWLEELVPAPRFVFTSTSMIAQMQAARHGPESSYFRRSR